MCIESWRKYCPDYEITEWNEHNYDFTVIPYMKEAYEAKKWGFVPDYARLDIIYRCGGIYLDTDVEIIRRFDNLLILHGFAGFQLNGEIALGLGFGAEAGNPVIKALRESYNDLHFIKQDGSPDITPSPKLNTKALVDSFGLVSNGEYQQLDGMTVFPPEYFCPKSFDDGIVRKTKNTYSIHHFDASWYTPEQKESLDRHWEYMKTKKQRDRKRRLKLWRRRVFGGFFRKLFGDERWEKIKKKLVG
ncbi:MAG: glycosyl transferase, partial [Clostridia bacterium]|nr:glycosyl transferase [Clostridia bacterium]